MVFLSKQIIPAPTRSNCGDSLKLIDTAAILDNNISCSRLGNALSDGKNSIRCLTMANPPPSNPRRLKAHRL